VTETILTNARLVLADAVVDGTIVIRNSRIAAIDSGRSALPGAVDCGGDHVIPGLVELHTDHLEKHFEPRPGVGWPAKVAAMAHDAQLAATGITTVCDAVAVGDILQDGKRDSMLEPMIEAVRWGGAAGVFRAEHFLHLRCEVTHRDVIARFEGLADDPLVRLVSLMDHTPGQRQFADVSKYRQYYQGKHGFSDERMDAFVAQAMAAQKQWGEANNAALVAACRARGVVVASHDDATPEHVAESVAAGAVLAEFPTTMEAARAARDAGLAILMGGPNLVLGGSHSGNVSARSLAEAGLLDVLSSDYVPSSTLQAVFALPECGVGLPDAVATVTSTPATLLGMTDRGALSPGLRADVVRVSAFPEGSVVRAVWRAGERVA
jgi:alpha-D-ribose 1-methylphosphonate 5-triphosphate diphosphatase